MILIKKIDKMCDKTYVIKCDSICWYNTPWESNGWKWYKSK